MTEMSERCAKSERGFYGSMNCAAVPGAEEGQSCQECSFKFITVHGSEPRCRRHEDCMLRRTFCPNT
jgi:hypothetical protein